MHAYIVMFLEIIHINEYDECIACMEILFDLWLNQGTWDKGPKRSTNRAINEWEMDL